MPIWFPLAPGVTLPAAPDVQVPSSPTYPGGATISVATYIQHLADGDDVGQGVSDITTVAPFYNETVGVAVAIRTKIAANVFQLTEYLPVIPEVEYLLSGNAVNFYIQQIYNTGVFNVTGFDVSFLKGVITLTDVGTFDVTGNDISLIADRVISAELGVFALTGQNARFAPIRAKVDTGVFTVTGPAVNLVKFLPLVVDTGTFSVTGNDVLINRTISLETGVFTLTGNDVMFKPVRLIVDVGTFALTGNAVTLDYSVVTDADFNAYIAEVELIDSQTLETPIKDAIEEFYVGTKADGNYTALKAATLLMGAHTMLGSHVDMITATTVLNSFNFVDDDYSRITGLEGDGSTTYLDTNRANDADLGGRDNNHNSVYASTLGTGVALATANSASGSGVNHIGLTDNRSRGATSSGVSMQVGFCGHARSESGSFDYRSGGSTTNTLATSDVPTSDNLNLFRTNIATTPAFGDHRIAFYSIGESVDLALLDQRVTRMVNLIQYYLYTGEDGAAYDTDTLIYVNNGYANGGGL